MSLKVFFVLTDTSFSWVLIKDNLVDSMQPTIFNWKFHYQGLTLHEYWLVSFNTGIQFDNALYKNHDSELG